MYCPKCGKVVAGGAAFCADCGAKLPAAGQGFASTAPDGGAQGGAGPARGAAPAGAPATRRRSKAPFIAAFAAIAAVAAAIGIAVYVTQFSPYSIDERTFPDSALRHALAEQADADGDGKISRDEAKELDSIDLSGEDVESIEGLELFENLRRIDVYGDSDLREIDTSPFPQLEEIDASDCPKLGSVVLSGEMLSTANLSGSGVRSIDASGAAGLRSLDLTGASVRTLDVSGSPELSELKADDSVNVKGLGSTRLHEKWLMTSFSNETYGSRSGSCQFAFEYDEKGRMTASYDATVVPDEKVPRRTYEYDADGRLSRMVFVNGNGSGAGERDYEYDGSGRLTQVAAVPQSGGTSYIRFEYDDAGRLAKVSLGDSDYRYSYDSDGSLSLVEYGGSGGSMSLSYEDGRLVRVDVPKRVSGRFFRDAIYEYGSDGALSKATIAPETLGDFPTYDFVAEGGRVVSWEQWLADHLHKMYTGTVSYDEHGNVTGISILAVKYSSSAQEAGTSPFRDISATYTRVFTTSRDDGYQPILMGDLMRIGETPLTPAAYSLLKDIDPLFQADVYETLIIE